MFLRRSACCTSCPCHTQALCLLHAIQSMTETVSTHSMHATAAAQPHNNASQLLACQMCPAAAAAATTNDTAPVPTPLQQQDQRHRMIPKPCLQLLLLLLTRTPSCSTAFMPISTLSSTVQPCSTAPWPTDTPLPILVLLLLGLKEPTDTPSCRLVLCPISTWWLSPACRRYRRYSTCWWC